MCQDSKPVGRCRTVSSLSMPRFLFEPCRCPGLSDHVRQWPAIWPWPKQPGQGTCHGGAFRAPKIAKQTGKNNAKKLQIEVAGHGQPWPAMAGHGQPWPVMARHDQPYRPTPTSLILIDSPWFPIDSIEICEYRPGHFLISTRSKHIFQFSGAGLVL